MKKKEPEFKKIRGWIYKFCSIPYTSLASKKEIERYFKFMKRFTDNRAIIQNTKVRVGGGFRFERGG